MAQPSPELVSRIQSRFSNNNFVMHSHLIPYANGVFPLASRLFNHSCCPNAIATFKQEDDDCSVHMCVRSIVNIEAGDEVTIPYLDPALPFNTRQESLKLNYGFGCACPACTWTGSLGAIVSPPEKPAELAQLDFDLTSFVFKDKDNVKALPLRQALFDLPRELSSCLHESYLPRLSSEFSDLSHDGPYDIALKVGLTRLALYAVVYPPGYPQTGMHALELAKTAWNMTIAETDDSPTQQDLLRICRHYLALAEAILGHLGNEGDDGGPLEEIATLKSLSM